MRSLEGANCADLPAFVIDKYFDVDAQRDRLHARVGEAICARCVVRDECLDEALSAPNLPTRGILGGVTVAQIRKARSWRNYEQGHRDRPPRADRPDWLPMTEATQQVEQDRLERDPDEPPIER